MEIPNSADEHFKRGYALVQLNRWNDAIPFFLKSLSANPNDVNPACQLANCFYQFEKYDEALNYAEKAIQLMPEFEYGHRLRSIILAKLERFEESLESALEATRISPQGLLTLGNLSKAYLRAKNLEKAKETAELSIRLYPEESRCHESLADIFSELEDYQNAELKYLEAIQLNPENSRLHNQLGVVKWQIAQSEQPLEKFDKKNEAIKLFADAVRLAPTDEYALSNLKDFMLKPPDRYLLAAFLPVSLIGMLVTPIWTVLVFLFAVWLYWENAKDFRKQTDSIPIEMRKALIPNYGKNDFTFTPNILFPRLKHYFSRIYLQLFIVFLVIIYFLYFDNILANGLFSVVLKIIFVINLLWITKQFFGAPDFQNTPN